MAILFIGHTRIGDAVLSTGILNHLIEEHGAARDGVTVACGLAAAPIFRAVPGVSEVLEIAKRSYSRHWATVWRRVAFRRWDLIVDLRNSIIPWTVLSKARVIVPRPRDGEHRIVQIARTLKLGDKPPPPKLTANQAQQDAAKQLLGEGPILGLGPTANWQGKIWQAENFGALVAELTGADGILPGAKVAVFGAPSERDIAAPVLNAVGADKLIDLVGTIDLPTAYACLCQCALYVGHDSGLMHMAAASGQPTLGLFGPSKPENYAPWGDHASYVRTRLSYDELVGGPGYDPHKVKSLMDSMKISDVVDAATTLYRKVRA